MAIVALYESFQSWSEDDTYVAVMLLILLFLLALFNGFRSFLANGVLIGWIVGCVGAMISMDASFVKRSDYIFWGLVFGLSCGILAKVVSAFASSLRRKESIQHSPPRIDSPNPAYWLAALSISGISLGLTLGLFFEMSLRNAMFCKAGLVLAALLVGAIAIYLLEMAPWIQAVLELCISLVLAAGIGAGIGWKFVLPLLMYDVNPNMSTEGLYRIATYSCSALGGLIGVVAWGVRSFRRLRCADSLDGIAQHADN
jgi:hypothetical protein